MMICPPTRVNQKSSIHWPLHFLRPQSQEAIRPTLEIFPYNSTLQQYPPSGKALRIIGQEKLLFADERTVGGLLYSQKDY